MASGKKNYFRHSFSAGEDEKIVSAIDQYGKEIYFHYFRLLELCGEQASDGMPEKFVFHPRTLCSNLLVKRNKLVTHLVRLQNVQLIYVECTDNKVEVLVPNLSKYLGSYRKTDTQKTPNKRKEKERKEKESKVKEKAPQTKQQSREKSDNKKSEVQDFISTNYMFLDAEHREWLELCSLASLKKLRESYEPSALIQEFAKAKLWMSESNKKYKQLGSFLIRWMGRTTHENKIEAQERAKFFDHMMNGGTYADFENN